MRIAIGAAIIKNGCILLVRKQRTWILPGGKPEIKESDIQCLLREFKQELPLLRLQVKGLIYFDDFTGTTPHKGDLLCVKVYLADADGEILPDAEINKAEWVKNPEEYNLSDITRKIVLSLCQKGYL